MAASPSDSGKITLFSVSVPPPYLQLCLPLPHLHFSSRLPRCGVSSRSPLAVPSLRANENPTKGVSSVSENSGGSKGFSPLSHRSQAGSYMPVNQQPWRHWDISPALFLLQEPYRSAGRHKAARTPEVK